MILRFAEWLLEIVESERSAPRHYFTKTMVDLSRPPNNVIVGFCSMKAYGMHLRCCPTEFICSSRNSGVTTFVNEETQEVEEFMGWVEEILEFNYRTTCVLVLVC